MGDEAKAVMCRMLDQFCGDPPNSDFQSGFMEGLVVFAHEGLGMRMNDPTFKRASDLVYAPIVGPQPTRRPFQVIKGGLDQ